MEQDPLALWESVQQVIAECCLARGTAPALDRCGGHLQSARDSCWPGMQRQESPLRNAISWQCARSAEICDGLFPHADIIRAKTGLPLATLISAGKWAWLLEHDARVQACTSRDDCALAPWTAG